MARIFSILTLLINLLLIAYQDTYAAPPDSQVPGRDDWYELRETYTDLPRIFNLKKEKCPAIEFYLDCNKCTCAKVNTTDAGCDIKPCPPIPQIVNWETGVSCPARKLFYNKCRDCTCDSTGTGARCTRKFCPDFSKEE